MILRRISLKIRHKRAYSTLPPLRLPKHTRQHHFAGYGGVRLVMHEVLPTKDDGDLNRMTDTRTPVLFIHGLWANHTFFLGTGTRGLARFVASTDAYRCFVLDCRGHAASEHLSDHAQANWHVEDWVKDIALAVHEVSSLCNNSNLFLIGHSLGGSTSLTATTMDEVQSKLIGLVVISSPYPCLRGYRRLLSLLGVRITPFIGLFSKYVFGYNEAESLGVIRSWMLWNLNGKYIGRDGSHDYVTRFSEVKLPFLLCSGSHDLVFTPPTLATELYNHVGASKHNPLSEVHICGKANGMHRNYSHGDIVTARTASKDLWPLIKSWLDKCEEAKQDQHIEINK